jgi:hypothetical protein
VIDAVNDYLPGPESTFDLEANHPGISQCLTSRRRAPFILDAEGNAVRTVRLLGSDALKRSRFLLTGRPAPRITDPHQPGAGSLYPWPSFDLFVLVTEAHSRLELREDLKLSRDGGIVGLTRPYGQRESSSSRVVGNAWGRGSRNYPAE